MRANPLDVGILILLTIFISVMIFIIQRTEARRRLFVIVIMLAIGELIRRYVIFRSETPLLAPFMDLLLRIFPQYPQHHAIQREAWIALIVAVRAQWELLGVDRSLQSGRQQRRNSSDRHG